MAKLYVHIPIELDNKSILRLLAMQTRTTVRSAERNLLTEEQTVRS